MPTRAFEARKSLRTSLFHLRSSVHILDCDLNHPD
jgi:hypothetical protein